MGDRGNRGREASAAAVVLVLAGVLAATAAACGDAYGEPPLDPDGGAPVTTCAIDCGPHGTCQGSGGAATCACAEGFVGADCATCAPGYQDDDRNGTCASKCETATCGPHTTCAVQGDAAVCSCMPSYTKDGTGACVWSGGPKDPGFQDMPAGSWKLEGGLTIVPGASGPVSPGLATFGTADCSITQRASQTFTMPAFADAEPLALTVSSVCTGDILSCGSFAPLYEMGLGGRYTSSTGGGGSSLAVTCLGERAYGGDIQLVFEGRCTTGGFGLNGAKSLDDVKLAPAPDCPKPGTIPNGDFEGTGGWTASAKGAEIAVNAGTGGSRAGHLSTATRCDGASLTGSISVPWKSMVSPALVMSVRGSSKGVLTLQSGQKALASVTGTGVFESVKVCLPQWSRGVAAPLVLSVYGGGGTCADPSDVDFLFDDLAIVSDPTCAEPGNVVDGGFERKGSARPWISSLQGGSTFSYVQSATSAHSGAAYGSLQGGATCAGSSFAQTVTIPDAKPGAGGPQQRFWYRTSGTAVTFTGGGETLPKVDAWTLRTRCLDPARAGRSTVVQVTFDTTGSACSYPRIDVDDVDVVLDPACPE